MASAEEPVRVVDARFEPDSVLLGDHFNLVMDWRWRVVVLWPFPP